MLANAIITMAVDVQTTDAVLEEVADERVRQRAKWGQQDLPDGTSAAYEGQADELRGVVDRAAATGQLTYALVLAEEFGEAMAETDAERLRAELLQVAAVVVAWVEAIDRRGGGR